MKNVIIGILAAIIIGGGLYYYFVIMPGQKTAEAEKTEAQKQLDEALAKRDSLKLITEILDKDIDSIIKKAESYAVGEKEALRRAKIEREKYLNLKKSIPETLQDCIDQSNEEQAHLLNELYNADEAYKNCDSSRTAYVVALKKCKEIPNINTGIDDLIKDIDSAWQDKYDAGIKVEKNKGNKKAGIIGVIGLIIGLLI